MPRFYFDVREGSTFLVDENGLEFSSLDEAEQEAIRGVVSMGKDQLPRGDTREVTVEVRDEDRKRMLTVGVHLIIDRVHPSA
jgi:methyl coenzyme M reductase gamma subunit